MNRNHIARPRRTSRDRANGTTPLTRRTFLHLAVASLPTALLAACGQQGGGTATPAAPTTSPASIPTGGPATAGAKGGAATPTPTTTTATAATARAATPAATSPQAAPAGSPTTVAFRVEEVARGLDTPWELAFAPDGRIFVTERPGRLRVIAGGQLRAEPVAMVPEVAEQGEGGLLGLALAHDFAASGGLYLYHTYRDGGAARNRIVRYTLADRVGTRGLGGGRVILDGIPGATTHNGGRLAFGLDGKLYATTGDAGNRESAQDRSSLAGKILRLDPDGAIPADNPFPGSPIYSYGHRNPQGLAWQPEGGQLFATEHGSGANDEVNRIVAGGNYGWPTIEGTQARDGLLTPLATSGTGNTWAPSGATFVRGATFPQLRGGLLFAGLRSTTLWHLTVAGTPRLTPLLQDTDGRLRAVTEGPDGQIYALTSNQDGRGNPGPADDRVLRLVPQR